MATGDIVLRVRGTISCQSIRQWRTYAGLLEGLPTRQKNERDIEHLLKQERERGWWAGEPYLVPPVVRPIEYEVGRRYPFGDPEALPNVTCVARYVAYPSELTIIWFQDEFAFPIDPQVLEHLQGLDWAGRAIAVEA
jgi:hypothetical protein